MPGEHGVSLNLVLSQLCFRKRESVIDNLVLCAQFEKYSNNTSCRKAENIQVVTIRSWPTL